MHDPSAAPRQHPAREISKALAARATAFCEVHLPHGHREGRFWRAGDLITSRAARCGCAWPRPGAPADGATTPPAREASSSTFCGFGSAALRSGAPSSTPGPSSPAQAPRPRPHRRRRSKTRAGAALRLWNLCRPLVGSHAEAYLRARGLEPRHAYPFLRFHPRLFHRDPQDRHRELPALVAALLARTLERDYGATWIDRHHNRLEAVLPEAAWPCLVQATVRRNVDDFSRWVRDPASRATREECRMATPSQGPFVLVRFRWAHADDSYPLKTLGWAFLLMVFVSTLIVGAVFITFAIIEMVRRSAQPGPPTQGPAR